MEEELIRNAQPEPVDGEASAFEGEEFEGAESKERALILGQGERRLSAQSLDISIEALVARIHRGGLILQPEFQRNYVWSSAKASQLVESVLLRIPLPIVYLSETEQSDWEVVDGQQRLTSLFAWLSEA
jgi:hypothetical protein